VRLGKDERLGEEERLGKDEALLCEHQWLQAMCLCVHPSGKSELRRCQVVCVALCYSLGHLDRALSFQSCLRAVFVSEMLFGCVTSVCLGTVCLLVLICVCECHRETADACSRKYQGHLSFRIACMQDPHGVHLSVSNEYDCTPLAFDLALANVFRLTNDWQPIQSSITSSAFALLFNLLLLCTDMSSCVMHPLRTHFLPLGHHNGMPLVLCVGVVYSPLVQWLRSLFMLPRLPRFGNGFERRRRPEPPPVSASPKHCGRHDGLNSGHCREESLRLSRYFRAECRQFAGLLVPCPSCAYIFMTESK
jgi:hypothetical protein